MDIEGSEIDFIKENLDFLSQLSSIMIEFHPAITGNLVIEESYKSLKNLGFKLVTKSGLVELWRKSIV